MMNTPLGLPFSVDQITYLEAEHVYVRLHFSNGQSCLERTSLTDLLDKLGQKQFVRVHRSYAINVKALRGVSSKGVLLDDTLLPIGRSWRKSLSDRLGQLDINQNQRNHLVLH